MRKEEELASKIYQQANCRARHPTHHSELAKPAELLEMLPDATLASASGISKREVRQGARQSFLFVV